VGLYLDFDDSRVSERLRLLHARLTLGSVTKFFEEHDRPLGEVELNCVHQRLIVHDGFPSAALKRSLDGDRRRERSSARHSATKVEQGFDSKEYRYRQQSEQAQLRIALRNRPPVKRLNSAFLLLITCSAEVWGTTELSNQTVDRLFRAVNWHLVTSCALTLVIW
jgi:hypothetical protein